MANIWIKQIHEQAPAEVLVIVVANKCDLRSTQDESSLVSQEELKNIEKSFPGVKCFECSAKNGTNIHEALNFLTGHACKRIKQPSAYLTPAVTTPTSKKPDVVTDLSQDKSKQTPQQNQNCNGMKSKSEDL